MNHSLKEFLSPHGIPPTTCTSTNILNNKKRKLFKINTDEPFENQESAVLN